MLFRLAYLGVTNALALLRLLPMSDRGKDAEILALRHQTLVLERHLHGDRPRLTRADRAWLAALLHPLPRTTLNHLRLLVHPETVLRWHRHLIARRPARSSRPHRAGRPRTIRSIRRLVLRLARENTTRRIRILGATAHPTAAWVTHTARNLVMDLEDTGCQVKYLIRDRDRQCPALFDTILTDAGIGVILTGYGYPG
ncbi:hypothetical protein GA0070216_108233 [Micromonospora matsumotoense]|uniref:Integrase n=1 Tax=Micromonospora matsumotoense TaxID=121616 RepID=A0A1C4Z7Q9_9ACTN|nr:hypothetical protein [Micromonospora matsumotoense]SCF28937.1 hypothetical protein GA0070216_108233 [Micromonospora matsumotoense]